MKVFQEEVVGEKREGDARFLRHSERLRNSIPPSSHGSFDFILCLVRNRSQVAIGRIARKSKKEAEYVLVVLIFTHCG